jgi:hypothetical protein
VIATPANTKATQVRAQEKINPHWIGHLGNWRQHDHRPHQARQQRAPLYELSKAIDLATRIKRRQTVQGLINEYARAA